MPELNDVARCCIDDLNRMADEGWRYTLQLGPRESMALLVTLQLALRHPVFPADTRQLIDDVARGIERALGQTGAIQEIIREGWATK